jgi:hypothetical protein
MSSCSSASGGQFGSVARQYARCTGKRSLSDQRIHQTVNTLPDRSIQPEHSAQKLLGLAPRTTSQWLADIGL